MKYWCMLKRKEETRSLSGMVAEIMVLGVRGQEIPRCCARSNACGEGEGGRNRERERRGREGLGRELFFVTVLKVIVYSCPTYQFIILLDSIG